MPTEDFFTFQQVNLVVPSGVDLSYTFDTGLGDISSWSTQFKVVDLETNETLLYLNQTGGAGTHGTATPNPAGQIVLAVDGSKLKFTPRPYPFGLKVTNGSNDKAIASGLFILREFVS